MDLVGFAVNVEDGGTQTGTLSQISLSSTSTPNLHLYFSGGVGVSLDRSSCQIQSPHETKKC